MIEKKIDYRRVLDFLEHKNSKIPDNLELLIKKSFYYVEIKNMILNESLEQYKRLLF